MINAKPLVSSACNSLRGQSKLQHYNLPLQEAQQSCKIFFKETDKLAPVVYSKSSVQTFI